MVPIPLSAQPKRVTGPARGPLCELGRSIVTRPAPAKFVVVKDEVITELRPLVVVTVTPSVCVPARKEETSKRLVHPTFGHPMRPGYAAQTSVRVAPYAAF